MKLYVASKTDHAAMWQRCRDEGGWTIVSTWIDLPVLVESEYENHPGYLSDLWTRCIQEVASADAVIAYHRAGDVWKGALVEIGAALASGVPVYVIGNPPGSWMNHPLVHQVEGDAIEFALLEAIFGQDR